MAREEVSSEFLRFLRIKHKVVQRLAKEVIHYQAEVKQHEATVSRMKAENREPSDIKQQQNVLDETVLMVPDAESRLLRACAELDDYMLSNKVCSEAVRSIRSGAAADSGNDTTLQRQRQEHEEHRQNQQQEQKLEKEAAGPANGGVTVAADAAGVTEISSQQQRNGCRDSDAAKALKQHAEDRGESSGTVVDKRANPITSSSTVCTTQQKQGSHNSTSTKETTVEGQSDSQGKQRLNDEAYKEVQQIFDTLHKIQRDLPHLHISLAAADEASGAGAAAAEDLDDEDI